MKIRTLTELQDALDEGLSWRIKEVLYVKGNAISAKSFAQLTFLRAGVPLIYAHWEGFIKQASEIYLSFVDSQNLRYRDLASCLVVFGAKKHLSNMIESRRSIVNIEAVEFFRNGFDGRASLSLSNAINTGSNLSSTVFENIAISIGVNVAPYQAFANFIDKSLLDRRNKIAHGEYLDINSSDFEKIADEVLDLMRMYKTDIENLASLKSYCVAPANS